jgi:exodeoxyribonuclease V alpha subunit
MTRDLHPRGTLRARFDRVADDDVFRRLGAGARRCDLGDQGLYLAEELVAADRWIGGSDPEALGILVLALMIAQRQGSTRLPLDPGAKGRLRALVGDVVRVAGLDTDVGKLVKRIASLTAAPRFNSVIGVGEARLPLVVDDGCLYTERARWLEHRVAERLAARIAAPLIAPPAIADKDLSAEQRSAVELAVTGKLAIVTGGPGTGKTRVIAAIVRAFDALGVANVALAAPTGKAANRVAEVVGRPALTLHRLLGYRSDGSFAHHERSPLPVGAVVVDEASMIDLELADALLAALPADAPLVLVGDANQLPAVDAGQILADLAETRVAVLEHSYRMDAADPRGRAVLEAARAVHAGSAPPAIARTPGTLRFEGVEHVQAAPTQVAEAIWHHFEGPRAQRLANELVFRFADGQVAREQSADLEQLWQLAQRARILAVTRELPTGARAINAHLHELALARMTVVGRPDFVPGEPVMITANDYQRGLYNGDQGLVIRAEEGLGHHRYRAVFRVGGQLVPFAIEALRDRLELAWALTVHKSQGSELDAVALVLPDDDLPLVTRELLYTGITRARTSVVLCASKAALAAAVKRRALRESGLRARLQR